MTAWVWLGLALLLVPPLRADRPDPVPRRAMSQRALQTVAAAAAGLAVLAVSGLTAGVVLAPLGGAAAWWTVTRLHARPPRARPDPALPFALDLASAALRAGQPLAAALVLAAPAAGERCGPDLVRVGRLLALGADPAEAWGPLRDDPVLGEVAAVACRSGTSGIKLASAWELTATELRAAGQARARARASRAGALATAPLGLCFLPAFVCLAIVPIVVGIASAAVGAAR